MPVRTATSEREREHRRIEWERVRRVAERREPDAARQRRRPCAAVPAHASGDAGGAARRAPGQAFGEHLRREPPAAGAERRPNRELALAAAACASSRFATFTHAISSTKPTAPRSATASPATA